MIKEMINRILTVLAIIPSTFFIVMSIIGIVNVISNFYPRKVIILLSILFGILGYVGLWMNLKQNKKKKVEVINFILLFLGIIGFVMFNSLEGGLQAWIWILTIEEPNEWLLFVGPVIITIILIIIKGKRLTTLYMKS